MAFKNYSPYLKKKVEVFHFLIQYLVGYSTSQNLLTGSLCSYGKMPAILCKGREVIL